MLVVMRTVLVVALAALAACASDAEDRSLAGTDPASSSEQVELSGRTFVVTRASAAGAERPLVGEVRLNFEESQVVVSTGCNTLRAGWGWDDEVVRFADLVQTEMGCDPELMEQEQWLAALLQQPMRSQVVAGAQVLTFGDAELVVVDREEHSPDLTLTGQRWLLDTVVSGETASSVPEGVQAWLELDDDGTARGHTGCNRGSGSWSETARGIRVELATTRMACPGPAGEVEQAVTAVLSGSVRAEVVEKRLTLTADGAALGFTAR